MGCGKAYNHGGLQHAAEKLVRLIWEAHEHSLSLAWPFRVVSATAIFHQLRFYKRFVAYSIGNG